VHFRKELNYINLVMMEASTSAQDCPADSVAVDGGVGESKSTSWFNKLKLSWEEHAPAMRNAVETTGHWGKKIASDVGQTCSKRLRSITIPSQLQNGLKEADIRTRRTFKRIGRFCKNYLQSINIPLSWKGGSKKAKEPNVETTGGNDEITEEQQAIEVSHSFTLPRLE
jgi:hypothetical protein